MKEIDPLEIGSTLAQLDANGYGILPSTLSVEECDECVRHYSTQSRYRSTINMQRYRFGKGEYKYFGYPLPPLIQELRTNLYPPLAQLANDWMLKLSSAIHFPMAHNDLIEQCHLQHQTRPTPLILHYEEGGFNTLHQDLYGSLFFPFQVVFLLSDPIQDFDGGEFVLMEQLPRAQSKATVIKLKKGDALIFTTNFRPVRGTRGYYRAKIKHGVSPLQRGQRYALGIIFHDAL